MKLKWKYSFACAIALFFILLANAQTLPDTLNRKLLKRIIVAESVTSVSAIAGLYSFWYADYAHSSFHFFNDNREWLQMDKVGHATTAYNMGKIGYELLRWPGVEKKRALWYGGTLGYAFLTTIEIMDGFSAEWGASPGDVLANTLGTALFMGQQFAWDEQRASLKWSFHKTKYSKYTPDVLGENLLQNMIKDYNGQTYWLSVNIHSFLPSDSRFPKFLNVAFGYGAEGMLRGHVNPAAINGVAVPVFERTRQYYLSLDLDLTRIKTNSRALNNLFHIISVVKFPFPAIEYNSGRQWKVHGFYF